MDTLLRIKTAIQENAKLVLALMKPCSLQVSTITCRPLMKDMGIFLSKGTQDVLTGANYSLTHLLVHSGGKSQEFQRKIINRANVPSQP